jgi:hypothetical protein
VLLFPTASLFHYDYQASFIGVETLVVSHVFGAVGVAAGHEVAYLRLRLAEQRGKAHLGVVLGSPGGEVERCVTVE